MQLVLVVVAAACGNQEPALTDGTPEASAATATTTAPTASTAAPVIDPGLAAAPWSVPPLPSEAVPSILKTAWDSAGNKRFCAALYPANANDLAADAIVRTADFGSDAWALAWDRPEGPGRGDDGEYCEECGRSAFGVAGTGLSPDESTAVWPDHIEWSDGSIAGYGLEGLADPASGAPHLAYLDVPGQGCLYNVWSFLGEDHLTRLLDELRYVEGMLAKVIDEQPQPAIEALAPVPWQRAPVGDAAVPQPLLDEWNEEVTRHQTCPLLTPVALGNGTEGASARRATNAGEMLAAWDLPSGPGRYGTGDYCANCGRGAFGIGTISRDAEANYERFAVTHTWADGSELRVVSEATEFFNVAPDRTEFTDPNSGAPVDAPYNAYLVIPGLSCGYRLWSFLGQDHLVDLTQGLRPVFEHGATLFTEGACPVEESLTDDFDGDGVDDMITVQADGDGVALIICYQEGPPLETTIAGTGELLAVADLDFDGDGEILNGTTSVTAAIFEVLTEGEGGLPGLVSLAEDGEPFLLTDGAIGGDGFRWGCRDDGSVVQLEGILDGGQLRWFRTAYRVEGLVAFNVGEGNGTTPVESTDLVDALFEPAVTELVGRSRCEG
ncbi:MAG: hypothetical protein V3R84_00970 [Acidimicrobiia bacterium]